MSRHNNANSYVWIDVIFVLPIFLWFIICCVLYIVNGMKRLVGSTLTFTFAIVSSIWVLMRGLVITSREVPQIAEIPLEVIQEIVREEVENETFAGEVS